MQCATCDGDADFVCEQCGRGDCLACHCGYEVPMPGVPPRLCWQCQAEADQEWLRTDLSKPRRTGPRPTPAAPDGQRSLFDDDA